MPKHLTLARRLFAGSVSGLLAGLVMAIFMMAHLAWQGHSVWTNANLIAAMWYGAPVANGSLTSATVAGIATHCMASVIMGVIAVAFVFGLPRWRIVLNSLAFALASYPVAFAAIMSWADPIMFRNAELVPMTALHAVFGLAFGLTYPYFADEQVSYTELATRSK